MINPTAIRFLIMFTALASIPTVNAARMAGFAVLDQEFLVVHVEDGQVEFADDASGPTAYGGHGHDAALNNAVRFGDPLDPAAAQSQANWRIQSPDDPNYAGEGLQPLAVHRKSKLNGMAEMDWNHSIADFNYDYTLEHLLYLRLPHPMVSGNQYTVTFDPVLGLDAASAELTFVEQALRSEAIRVNLHGFTPDAPVMAADLYAWMGDGNARDFSSFVGATVRLLNVDTETAVSVGQVTHGANRAADVGGYDFNFSDWWRADFTGTYEPGTYRLVIDGIGSSADFQIREDIYLEPFRVSTLGYFYMRIGQDNMNMVPAPRRPLWIPRNNPLQPAGHPEGFRVVKTSLHPWHPDWNTFSRASDPVKNDPWDGTHVHWAPYILEGWPENSKAWGGHSDALDWDRHLGHVSSIHDMLLPFILTEGRLGDDDTGIAESGNGIPDILDSARFEVDFWLRLRDADGYAHGISNIDDNANLAHQAAATGMAAWAAAANAAMLADAFRIAGLADLRDQYTAHARTAWQFAAALPADQQMLDLIQDVGFGTFRGRDFRFMAAAFLFNLTAEPAFEAVVRADSLATSSTARLAHAAQFNQLYGTVAYLLCPHEVADPTLQARMRASLIHQAMQQETNHSATRPSRRGTDVASGYFHTIQNMQRTIAAHALSNDPDQKADFLRAMILEADWGLGRNPLNRIQMTTATTALAHLPSVDNAYTSGRNDGTPGLHPGHTPYFNMDDWAPDMVMGRPSWLIERGYPNQRSLWPQGELAFSTRYVWAHSEFTPQQTMRGKQALYSYLYALSKDPDGGAEPLGFRLQIDGQNGTILIKPLQQFYAAGSSVELTAIPDPGFIFSEWAGVASGSQNPTTITMTADAVVSARFVRQPSSAADIAIYRDAGGILSGVWSDRGTLTELQDGGPEGQRHYAFAYTVSDYWAGFGLNLDQWGSGPALDLTSMNALNLFIHGPSHANAQTAIRLLDSEGNSGPTVLIPHLSTYISQTIPLSQLADGSALNLAAIKEISVSINGIQNGTGQLFIDDVFFSAPATSAIPRFSDWIADPQFSVPAGQRGLLDTPARDGVNNLLKYAFNLPPMETTTSANGLPQLAASINPVPHLSFTYRRYSGGNATGIGRYQIGDLRYSIEISTNLQAEDWHIITSPPATQAHPISNPDATESVTVTIPLPSPGQAGFMRVLVELQPE